MRTITVTGTAHVKKPPELAYLSVNVHAKGTTTKSAKQKQSELMHLLLGALAGLGIPNSAIKTERYNAQQANKYDEKKRQHLPDGFVVSQQLTVTIDVEMSEEVVGALAEHTADLSVGFGLKNHEKETSDALCLAIANARAKAVKMAHGCDNTYDTLGDVLSCQEGGRSPQGGGVRMMAMSASADEMGGGARAELPTGEIEIHATVTMQFELKQASGEVPA